MNKERMARNGRAPRAEGLSGRWLRGEITLEECVRGLGDERLELGLVVGEAVRRVAVRAGRVV